MNTTAILMAGKARIADRQNWTQGAYARDDIGLGTSPDSYKAVKWCADGALLMHEGASEARALLREAARFYQHGDVTSLNDSDYGHIKVLAAYDLAIARSRQPSE